VGGSWVMDWSWWAGAGPWWRGGSWTIEREELVGGSCWLVGGSWGGELGHDGRRGSWSVF
jgi:hypothetical protein